MRPPPTSDTFTYNTGEPEDDMAELKIMMRKVLADNLDLRHQVSVLASQIATMQTGMTAQFGGMAAQMANLSQQIARSSRTNQSANPQPATTPAKAKPALKLTMQKDKTTAPTAEPPAQNQPNDSYASVTAAGDPGPAEREFTLVTKKTNPKAPRILNPSTTRMTRRL